MPSFQRTFNKYYLPLVNNKYLPLIDFFTDNDNYLLLIKNLPLKKILTINNSYLPLMKLLTVNKNINR